MEGRKEREGKKNGETGRETEIDKEMEIEIASQQQLSAQSQRCICGPLSDAYTTHPQAFLYALLPRSRFPRSNPLLLHSLTWQEALCRRKTRQLVSKTIGVRMGDKRVCGACGGPQTAAQSVGDMTSVLPPASSPLLLPIFPVLFSFINNSGAFLPENADLWEKGRGREEAGSLQAEEAAELEGSGW